jgi:hypothetical protein
VEDMCYERRRAEACVDESARGGRCGGAGGSVGVLRARRCHLRAGFQQCKAFVEVCSVRCCPLRHPAHCPMGMVPRVLVRRTASPAHADFGGLNSGAPPSSSDSTSCLSRPALPRRRWRVVGWVDILLDVIGGVESALREGCPRTTTGVSQRWFSGHFRQVFFNTIALPRIIAGADVWGESSIMTARCLSTLVLIYFAHRMGSV